ncbi:MAG: sulfur oxidation c-type cytochrome SoxX [Campylobacterota bacterium]|nr:sulfur oxidation c-type cytochrome SoxX [Campylobacterota bacterium]
MQRKFRFLTCATMLLSTSVLVNAADLTKAYDMPDASKMIEKDLLPAAKKYTMPKGCVSNDAASIARGEFIFHNLNGKKAKKKPPAGLAKFVETKGKNGKVKKKAKQYGNCVACHNIEGAKGGGNIGPDLTGYKAMFIDTKVRDYQFVYQKIADPRTDNANTHMTVNLTTKLFNEQEICDLSSYVVSVKK